jgi:hypothetical protein
MKYGTLFLLLFLCTWSARAQFVAPNDREIGQLKKLVNDDPQAGKLYRNIKKLADQALSDTPNPVDTVVSEGHLATDPRKIVTTQSLKDIEKIYDLAIAYRIEDDKAYRDKALAFITAWAMVNQPMGNPINDTKFEALFFAYDLVKKEATADQKKTITGWLQRMADAEIATAQPKTKKTTFNNWNSHRLKVIGAIAYVLDDARYKAYIDEQLPIQIERNLLPDGTGIDLLERDAFHYHIYTLEPLISLATVLKRATGKDFYVYTSPSGASIKNSVDYLIPFVSGEKTHPEFVNSQVPFDKKRAANHEAGYETGALFHPASGYGVLIQASYFDPSCLDVVKKRSGNANTYPSWQAVLNAIEK